MSDNPTDRRAGRVFVVDATGAVLLLRGSDPARPSAGSWWFTPGGGADGEESTEAAARRELREETGLDVAELGPVVFTRHTEFDFEGVRYRQYEEFFCVRSPRFTIDDTEWTEIERRTISEHRWWTLAELETTGDTVHPEQLARIVRDLLASN